MCHEVGQSKARESLGVTCTGCLQTWAWQDPPQNGSVGLSLLQEHAWPGEGGVRLPLGGIACREIVFHEGCLAEGGLLASSHSGVNACGSSAPAPEGRPQWETTYRRARRMR